MNRTVGWAAEKLGQAGNFDGEITGWSIDSRSVQAGDLFFALRGPNHDGNAHVAAAFERGAVAAVVDGDVNATGCLLRVSDSLAALQQLARAARHEWDCQVIAVTGSAGKTTTKDVIAALLAEGFPTTKTVGNLNNHIGLPLSLLRMEESARLAVVEMGMNHAGEIAQLAEIARPNVGVVTNVGWAHIENFSSIEGIAAAKRELIDSLDAEGTAVLNVDDPRVAAMAVGHRGRVVRYGVSPDADVRAEDVVYGLDGVRFRVAGTAFESPLTGRHNVSNLLAGIAVAGVEGISPDRLRERVRAIQPPRMRGERIAVNGILIYNDCYNSNPDATRAMLDVLRDTPARRRIAVLGEMLELGDWSERLHREVGSYAAHCGVDVLIGIHGAAQQLLEAAQASGLRADSVHFFADSAAAAPAIHAIARSGDAILFKGSRGIRVEEAMQDLLAANAPDPSAMRGGAH